MLGLGLGSDFQALRTLDDQKTRLCWIPRLALTVLILALVLGAFLLLAVPFLFLDVLKVVHVGAVSLKGCSERVVEVIVNGIIH